jgi:hypothetical protein
LGVVFLESFHSPVAANCPLVPHNRALRGRAARGNLQHCHPSHSPIVLNGGKSHTAQSNNLHHPAVGIYVAHNVIHDTPHVGVLCGSIEPNECYQGDPGFSNPQAFDFSLGKDATLLKDFPAFEQIPFEKIGLRLDEYRKTLPGTAELNRAGTDPVAHGGFGYDILDRK